MSSDLASTQTTPNQTDADVAEQLGQAHRLLVDRYSLGGPDVPVTVGAEDAVIAEALRSGATEIRRLRSGRRGHTEHLP